MARHRAYYVRGRAMADLSTDRKFQFAVTHAWWVVAAFALIYAMLAGLHTLQDFDLWWQLATGRWIAQHHQIFSTDVFSYTAFGQPWIYPVLSGLIFYACFVLGGYTLLSWLGAFACAGTVALLLRRNSLAVSALALVAVPLIANRTQPRAEMFTTVLFAAFMALLWKHYQTGKALLWLLPALMVLWVNLHPGFVAGLLLCSAYVSLEVLRLAVKSQRQSAVDHLRRYWPWLALTWIATLINPWGAYIYAAVFRQQRAQSLHNLWIVEWEGIHPSWASLHQAMDWREPQSSFWWLAFAAFIGIGFALWRRQSGAALMLGAAMYFAFQHVRLQALFACVVVVVAGPLLGELIENCWCAVTSRLRRPHLQTAATSLLALILFVLSSVRSYDLVSDIHSMRSNEMALFGTGISSWYPERAMEFLKREKLPGQIFNGYALGGYLTWKSFPDYRVYIDSRALPFGPKLFFRSSQLAGAGPDSAAWKQEADARGINTIIVPLSRYQGMTLFPQLHAFCHSKSWAPVYLDEVSAIFVRQSPQTAALIQRLAFDCDKLSFSLPSGMRSMLSRRTRAELFNAWANAGGVLYALERYPEALDYLNRAQAAFADNANFHLVRALVLQEMGRAVEAEAEFEDSLRLEPNDQAWFDFGLFYMTQKRYADAAEIFRQSAETSPRPHEAWMMLGQAELQMRQPDPALAAFDKAEQSAPFRDGGESIGAGFYSLIATGRAKAWYQLGDAAKAVEFQEQAVQFAPDDAKLWMGLADLYEVQGRTTKAAEARAHAGQHR
ncbi:MAG TPA: tetratricopeptide repeat protein [Candidatus Sulfotelmatobacter sp.]|nr:tetratricopeptide repeat protein [Candidatus Sulfotelmatobacter sp.]